MLILFACFHFQKLCEKSFTLPLYLHSTTKWTLLKHNNLTCQVYLSIKVDTFFCSEEISCRSAEVFVSVIWLAAATAGKSSASLFPQDVVAWCDRATPRRLRHRRRRRWFLPQSLLGQEVCERVWGWAGKSRSGGPEGKDVESGVASESVWENRSDV